MNSLDTRFSRNVFEAVQKTHSTCLSTDARVLNITKSLVKKVLKLEVQFYTFDSLNFPNFLPEIVFAVDKDAMRSGKSNFI